MEGKVKDLKVWEGKLREENGREENNSSFFAKKNLKGYFASNMQQYYPLRFKLWSNFIFC
jgi:hypothetical protein